MYKYQFNINRLYRGCIFDLNEQVLAGSYVYVKHKKQCIMDYSLKLVLYYKLKFWTHSQLPKCWVCYEKSAK